MIKIGQWHVLEEAKQKVVIVSELPSYSLTPRSVLQKLTDAFFLFATTTFCQCWIGCGKRGIDRGRLDVAVGQVTQKVLFENGARLLFH